MKFKLEQDLLRRRRIENDRRRPLSRGNGSAPRHEVVHAEHLGEIGAGRVVPFIPRSELVPVLVPEGTLASDIFTLTVRGISLTDRRIYDGDILILKKRFTWSEIKSGTICAVFIHSTGELVAKKIVRGANMLILRASGGGIADREVNPDDIEIRGIVFAVQRPIDGFGEEL